MPISAGFWMMKRKQSDETATLPEYFLGNVSLFLTVAVRFTFYIELQ